MNKSYHNNSHRILIETYKGFDIVFDSHTYLRTYQLFKSGNIQSALYFASPKACRTAIDTFTRDKECEIKVSPPITEEQLHRFISKACFI